MDEYSIRDEDSLKPSSFVGVSNSKREVTEAEKALAKKWGERLRSAQASMGPWYEKIKKYRKYVRGEQNSDDGGGLVRANLVHSHIKRSVNKTYARNPKFAIRPVENVNPSSYQKVRLFGKTAEIVLNRYFEDADLKRRGKACLRAAKTTGVGWVKVFYQTITQDDPVMKNRMKDAMDDLEQLQLLREKADSKEDHMEKDRKILELEQFLSSLEQESEKIISEGLTIDVVDSERILLDLSTTKNFDDYVRTPFIAEEILMTPDDAKRRWGEIPPGTKTWNVENKNVSMNDNPANGSSHSFKNEIIKIWEIWDRENRLVHYLPDGASEFIQEPLKPQVVGEQWFPYFPLGTNIVDGQFYPVSDVELLMELQDEHNSSRTRFAAHKDMSIPHWVGKREDISERDAKSIASAKAGEIVLVDAAAGRPLRESIDVFSPPPIDPAVYGTEHTERDMERVAGGGEVTQPKSNRSRTLGEAQLLSQDVGVQTTADSDEVEDWFKRVAKHTLEVLLQVLTKDQVQKIAGVLAVPKVDEETGVATGELEEGAVWPEELSKGEIFNMLKIQIQVGSSGHPNVNNEMKLWTQFIMPKVTELIVSVADLREKKEDALADSLIMVAQETIRRMDERFDVDEFIPRQKDQQPDPAQQQQMQQAQEAQQLQMEQIKAGIEETYSKAAKNNAEIGKIQDSVEQGKFKDGMDAYKAETKLSLDKQKIVDRQEETATANAVKLAGAVKNNNSE
jgi:hypothetical protein